MRVMQFAGAEVEGGLLRHVEILSRGLAASGHEVHAVLSPASGADATAMACAASGARVTRLAVRGKTDLSGLLRFGRLVSRESPDVLHVHLSSPVEAIPAMLAARWSSAPRLVTTEHAPTWFPLEKTYSRAAKRAAGRSIDAVIALSHADARFLAERFGLPASRITVIPNGVPMPHSALTREEARSRLGLPHGAWPLVGFAGALVEKKGVLDLVEAAARLAGEGFHEAAVALAGEGALEPELRARARRPGVPLALCGRLRDVSDFMTALDLFALPSHQEAMPLALLEAMATGLPIVATRVGGVAEAIDDGVNGLLVEPARPEQLSAALARLCRDEALRHRVARAARETAVARFDAGLMVRRIETLYRGVAAGAIGAPS